MGIENIKRIKEDARVWAPKSRKPIAKKSAKRISQEKEYKKQLAGDDTLKEQWFKARRREMVGVCQCGCAEPSQRDSDVMFRGSAAHIFPKRIFESVMYHPLNWVERRVIGGCHHNMDDRSLDLWPGMADWDDIKEKFYILAPLLTDEERANKFYKHLERLVYER